MPRDHGVLLPALDPRRTAPDQPLPVPGWLNTPVAGFLLFLVLMAAAVMGLVPVLATLQLVATSVAYLVLVLWHERRRPPVELDPGRAAGLLAGMGLGAASMALIFLVCWASGWREVTGLDWSAPVWQQVYVAGLVAGVSEEMIFRGVLFRLTETGLGTWGATLLSGGVFGAAHLTNPGATWWGALAIALEAGISFALLYALTRSLWVVIGVHAAWNVVQGPVLGSAVSGATANGAGVVVSFPRGPELLSGGGFGLEASLVSVLLWLPVTVWLAVQLVRRRRVVPPLWARHPARPLPTATSQASTTDPPSGSPNSEAGPPHPAA